MMKSGQLLSSWQIKINNTQNRKELEKIRIKILGRKGLVNQLLAKITQQPPSKKKEFGRQINKIKKGLFTAIKKQESKLQQESKSQGQKFDPTIPTLKPPLGKKHPLSQTIEEIADIFEKIGFIRVKYPEITTDWYCFGGVNVPPDHPSRDDQETFFLENGLVLSTHTTSGILQEIERVKKPPIRMLHIAKCYRRQIDIAHTPMFHQFEGWLVDKNVSVAHLKWTLDYFAREFFGIKRVTRLRPHHFRYTEPSFEVDITCGACLGNGCRFCKEGWVELGGAGMAHPTVLKNAGLDPKIYSALAFGWGVERVFAIRTGIADIRPLFKNNLDFLNQF
ncbi:phenylalanine--tRNA ligase subunit alpha [Candidatus Shapirobacteria bacterium]|nr:phenylalanine--tRNA ligase subunit alpha [Candidatus Shapirobacteria bacterium]